MGTEIIDQGARDSRFADASFISTYENDSRFGNNTTLPYCPILRYWRGRMTGLFVESVLTPPTNLKDRS
jgi:hypothetical protein